MIIRESMEQDYDRLVDIWLQASIQSHYFVKKQYWESMSVDMKEKYLPMAKTHIVQNHGMIVGFISLIDDYLAALFIDVNYQRRGYGKILLDFAKGQLHFINLKVYQKNIDSVLFYLKNDFVILRQLIDEETDEKEYMMIWRKHMERQ